MSLGLGPDPTATGVGRPLAPKASASAKVIEAAASALGQEPTALRDALRSGKTLLDVAEERNVDASQLKESIAAALTQHGPSGRTPETIDKLAESIMRGSKRQQKRNEPVRREVPQPRESPHGPRLRMERLASQLGVPTDDILSAIQTHVEARDAEAPSPAADLYGEVVRRLGTVGVVADERL